MKYSNDKYTQHLFETAVEIKGLEYVLQKFCNYILDEYKRDFIGHFCDDENCYPSDIDDYF